MGNTEKYIYIYVVMAYENSHLISKFRDVFI